MKQAESAAHSSGRSGGERRVLESPGAGVLQNIPIATVLAIHRTLKLTSSSVQVASATGVARASGNRLRSPQRSGIHYSPPEGERYRLHGS